MNNSDFIKTAENIYKANPREFGLAFWKYRELIKNADIFDRVINGVRYMYAVNRNRLVYYWSEDNRIIIDENEFSNFDLLTLHEKYGTAVESLTETHNVHRGIAQIYDKKFIEMKSNSDYFTDYFDFSDSDYSEAFDIFNEENGHLSKERIKAFTELNVFDGSLWVFVREKKTGEAVSLGISIYDAKIRETELEWIAVKKEYWGKRVGRMLIAETIRRAKDKSDIIRVGGIVDDFYYKCGFQIKTNRGFYITKNNTKVGWWD